MLKTLQIRNFAIIEREELEFSPGLNIITGETGAGKSIIVDALMMALGERASTDSVRQGEKKSIIEAKFEIDEHGNIARLIEEEGYDSFGSELILRREISPKGSSRAFINDSPAPAGEVKKFGELLVDFHGQHQHQSLLHKETHGGILDKTGNYENILKDYKENYAALSSQLRRFRELSDKERSLREKEDLLRFKLKEIKSVDPEPGEDKALEQELRIKENSEKLYSLTSDIYSQLFVGDNSIHDRLSAIEEDFEQLAGIDSEFREYLGELNSATIAINEISKYVKDYNSSIEFSPERIEDIRSRLLELKGLTKKFGPPEEVIRQKKKIEDELDLIENYDEEIEKRRKEIADKQKQLGRATESLGKARRKAAEGFEEKVVAMLTRLGMPDAVFRVNISRNEYTDNDARQALAAEIDGKYYSAGANGCDDVEFLISTNIGESPLPLRSIASGGEISRIMLAIKSITAERDDLELMVFDEIDTGISGRIARKTGMAIKRLARHNQIIAITHLPQIAAMGELNYNVVKQEANGRTIARAIMLRDEDKTGEIAKLIAGEEISEAAMKSARELIEKSDNIDEQ
jgi:DNA repair protein RecN (Recombination protein N)